MEPLFIIQADNAGLYYIVFYSTTFLVATGIFIFHGLRNHYPARTWLVIALFAIMCGIIGNKVVTIEFSDWKAFFQYGYLPETGRSVLGLIPGLIFGVLIAPRILRFNRPVIDHLAYALPAGMVITRLGCLLAGCCHGIPANLPWSVQYGPASRAFHFHDISGFIAHDSILSLPVHPTQIYDILFCLVIILLVWLTRNYWKAPGSSFLFMVILYAGFRFFNEFLRQSPQDQFIFNSILGIKILQWILFGALVIMVLILILRERKSEIQTSPNDHNHTVSLKREFLLFSTVPLFLILAFGWLDYFESLVIMVLLVPLFFAFIYDFYSRLTVRELRWKVPLLMLVAVVGMSQISTEVQDKPAKDKYRGWFSVDAFGGLGSYPEKVFDCDGNVSGTYQRDYTTWGAGFAWHYKPKETHHLRAGINFYSTTDGYHDSDGIEYSTPAMNAMVGYNMKHFGGTLGMNVFFDEFWISNVVPVGDLWLGQRDVLFVETRFMTDYHFLGPPGLFQLGIGSGFRHIDKSIGRAGISIKPSTGLFGDHTYAMGAYIGGDFLVKNRVTIRGNVLVGKYFGGSLGASVHLGEDRWTSKVKQ